MSHTWEQRADYMREERDAAVAEAERLRKAIEAHKTATRYNPRAAWVNARLWNEAGLGDV